MSKPQTLNHFFLFYLIRATPAHILLHIHGVFQESMPHLDEGYVEERWAKKRFILGWGFSFSFLWGGWVIFFFLPALFLFSQCLSI